MKKTVFLLALFISSIAFGQLENANWCFRENARINFNTAPPTPTTCASGGWVQIYGGSSASVSDASGQLLFYTDGITVWDRTNNPMPNGLNIDGGADSHYAQQHVVIVQKPQHPSIYYIFTVNHYDAHPPSGRGGLHYSIVDMGLGTNGDVDPALKNIPLANHNGQPLDYDYINNTGVQIFAGRITTTVNNNNDKVWVSFFTRYTSGLSSEHWAYSYLVTANGVHDQPDGTVQPPDNSVQLNNANYPNTPNWPHHDIGSIKISPNGQFLCDVTGDAVNMYTFNNQTGAVTYSSTLYNGIPSVSNPGYGVEFSPNSQFVYYSSYDNNIFQDGLSGKGEKGKEGMRIYQCAVKEGKPVEIGNFLIHGIKSDGSNAVTPIPVLMPNGALQLGIDNKIYVCSEVMFAPFHTWLGAIQLPDVQGLGCSFNPNGIQLAFGTTHEGSLPQWVHKTTSVWPKVYEWGMKAVGNLTKDNFGNIFYSFYSDNMQNNLNHTGASSSNPSSFFTAQYNQSSGYTNWIKPNYYLSSHACLANGDIRLSVNSPTTFSHFNSTSGIPVSNTTTLSNTEIVMAETPAAEYLSYDLSSSALKFHPTTGPPVTLPYQIQTYFYSPVTGNLYTRSIHTTGNSGQAYIDVYHIANGSVSLVHSTIQTIDFSLINLDNAENLYVVNNSTNNAYLEKYDYLTNTFTPLVISNFNNSNLIPLPTPNYYPSDYLLVYNKNDNKLYSLHFDIGNNSVKSLATSNIENFVTGGALSNYVYVGTDLFLCGVIYDNQDITLGDQTISPLSANTSNHYNSNFLTKFNIDNDFSFRQGFDSKGISQSGAVSPPAFDVNLFPNPATNSLKIDIIESNKAKNPVYTLSIRNRLGNIMVKKERYITGNNLDISGLNTGIYFVEIINAKGEKVSKGLLKL